MNSWSKDELQKIAESDDLHISPFREDGKTYGTPTWIWSVAVDGALYVRAYNGRDSRWYQAAMRQKAGRITAAGLTKEVTFEPVEGPINDRIDAAYRAKYKGSPYLDPMIGARARSARAGPENIGNAGESAQGSSGSWRVGQRVAWINVLGSYATQVIVPAAQAIPVPDRLTTE